MKAEILSHYDSYTLTESHIYPPIYRKTKEELVKAVNNFISKTILPKKKYQEIKVTISSCNKVIDSWNYFPSYMYENENDVMYIIDNKFIVFNGVTVKECKTRKILIDNISKYCKKYNLK